MELLNGKKINIGKEFPTVFTSKKSNGQEQSDILKKTGKEIKDPGFEGNMVIMVKKKSKKKRGRKRKEKFVKIVAKSDPTEKKEKEGPMQTEANLTKPKTSKQTNSSTKHKRWDQYYESLFFISHVLGASG